MFLLFFFFFFSSRRRHTRSDRDWSSDVCSSDLRAAVFGLKERGAEVYVLNRTAAPAQKLAHQARARIAKRPDLKKLAFDVIINATPVGMGNTRESPLHENEINARYLFDMIYDPAETLLMK